MESSADVIERVRNSINVIRIFLFMFFYGRIIFKCFVEVTFK